MENVINLIKEKLDTEHVYLSTDIESMDHTYEVFWIKENIKSRIINIKIKAETLLKISPEKEIFGLSNLLDNIRAHMDKKESYFSDNTEPTEVWEL